VQHFARAHPFVNRTNFLGIITSGLTFSKPKRCCRFMSQFNFFLSLSKGFTNRSKVGKLVPIFIV
jgi:hypothetical protein